jgi:Ras-related C3 botulinum toxin substrate 1
MHDTAGLDGYETLRPRVYPQTDVFLICFSLANRDSLSNVSHKWMPELHNHCPKVPVILVGTKLDLRNDEKSDKPGDSKIFPVLSDDALKVQKQIKAVKYIECSAITSEGLSEVFEAAIRVVLDGPKEEEIKKSCLCNIL